jgi:hypothetical protein
MSSYDFRDQVHSLKVQASVKRPLYGHTDMNSAFLVDDYPYGFQLRTQIRYWLEYKPSKGYRFVSQTKNPKTGQWNKPKASTYMELAGAMYLDEKDHVQWTGLGIYSDAPKVAEFVKEFPHADHKMLKVWVAKKIAFYTGLAEGKIKWTINGVTKEPSEDDLGRARADLDSWRDVLKHL